MPVCGMPDLMPVLFVSWHYMQQTSTKIQLKKHVIYGILNPQTKFVQNFMKGSDTYEAQPAEQIHLPDRLRAYVSDAASGTYLLGGDSSH